MKPLQPTSHDMEDESTVGGVNIDEEANRLKEEMNLDKPLKSEPKVRQDQIGLLVKSHLLKLIGHHCRAKIERNSVKMGAVKAIAAAAEQKMAQVLTQLIHVARCRTMQLPPPFLDSSDSLRHRVHFLNAVSASDQRSRIRRERDAARESTAKDGALLEAVIARKRKYVRKSEKPSEDFLTSHMQEQTNRTAMRALKPTTSRQTVPSVRASLCPKLDDGHDLTFASPVSPSSPLCVDVIDMTSYLPHDVHFGGMAWAWRLMLTGKREQSTTWTMALEGETAQKRRPNAYLWEMPMGS